MAVPSRNGRTLANVQGGRTYFKLLKDEPGHGLSHFQVAVSGARLSVGGP